MVDHLVERLTGTDDGRPKVLRESVVTNFDDFFAKFRNLNIGSSVELEQVVERVRRIVSGATTESLRSDMSLRDRISTGLVTVQSTLDTLMTNRPRRNLIRRNAA